MLSIKRKNLDALEEILVKNSEDLFNVAKDNSIEVFEEINLKIQYIRINKIIFFLEINKTLKI